MMNCTCDAGWATGNCSVQCSGDSAAPCSNQGVCADGAAGDGSCTCAPAYEGTDCSVLRCAALLDFPARCEATDTSLVPTSTRTTPCSCLCEVGYADDASLQKANCARCDSDYGRLLGECRPCGWTSFLLIVAAALAYLAALYGLHHFSGKRSDSLTTARMAVVRLQIFLAHFSFGLSWPPFVLALARALRRVFSFEILALASPECVVGRVDAATAWSLTAWAPLAFVLPFVGLALRSWEDHRRRYAHAAIVYNVASLFLSRAAATVFAPALCEPSGLCDSEGRPLRGVTAQAVAAAGVYIVLPALLLRALLRAARAAEEDGAARAELFGRLFGKYDYGLELWDLLPKSQ